MQGLRLCRLQKLGRCQDGPRRAQKRAKRRAIGQTARTGSHEFVLCQLAIGYRRKVAQRDAKD